MIKNNKLIVNFAPTGLIPTKEMTPHVKPEELRERLHLQDGVEGYGRKTLN